MCDVDVIDLRAACNIMKQYKHLLYLMCVVFIEKVGVTRAPGRAVTHKCLRLTLVTLVAKRYMACVCLCARARVFVYMLVTDFA